MKKNKQKLNRHHLSNGEMFNSLKKNPLESKTGKIRKIINKLMIDGNKLMLKYEIDRIKGTDKDKSLVDFMRFLLENIQNGLKKINDISHEIDKEPKSLEGNKKANK